MAYLPPEYFTALRRGYFAISHDVVVTYPGGLGTPYRLDYSLWGRIAAVLGLLDEGEDEGPIAVRNPARTVLWESHLHRVRESTGDRFPGESRNPTRKSITMTRNISSGGARALQGRVSVMGFRPGPAGRVLLAAVLVGVAAACCGRLAFAAATVTFTADDRGTYPATLRYDGKTQLLSVDLSALPRDATIFRAELVLQSERQFEQRPVRPTSVYPPDRPDKKLKFVEPRSISLDALEPVRAAVRQGGPLVLKLETTLRGVRRLEVSCLECKPRGKLPAVESVTVAHRRGQSLIVFQEPRLAEFPTLATGADAAAFRNRLIKEHPDLVLRIWRSDRRIDQGGIAGASLVGECGLLTCWNDRYHQDATKKQPPVRYRVRDNGEPLAWGAGVYAHNPAAAGKAFYAVTVAVGGEEDLDQLSAANCTAEPVAETVGPGEPVLQWIEKPDPREGWHYRRGELVRMIYTRWESGRHSSTPSNPIDYLVAAGLTPRPEGALREPQYKAYRVEPAPVGLHLHCWGGSVNGGYGWWYNAHRGAVLIASNQIPYDWWTGYHESRGTCKTLGDGHVQPYTMNRVLGFLDWAARQWQEAPEEVRGYWPKLDLARVFTAGSSMGGSGAPMYALRHGDRVAWAIGWVGVHVPELSPQFAGSYRHCYGPRDPAVTMPDGKTSPWDFYSDVWWLRANVGRDTGLVIASNGKNDGAIGWKQAWLFARALQETRRPHIFNWGMGGHGTHTVVGSNFELDVRTDRSLPAFSNCSLDDPIGDGDPASGSPTGQYNAYLWWDAESIVDEPDRWQMTVRLQPKAPQEACTVDLTPRRCQQFHVKPGDRLAWSNHKTDAAEPIATGEIVADQDGLATIPRLAVAKAGNRIAITRK